MAAARIILAMRALALDYQGLRTTVGRLEISPNTINVIAGCVRVATDFRSRSTDLIDTASRRLAEVCATVARDDGLRVTASEFWRSPPTSFHKTVINAVAAAAAEHEYSTHRLWSGAGHDAKYVAEWYPAGMIFVPCKGGLSHNEAEWASKEDCARGAAVLLDAAQRLAKLV